MMEQYKHAIEAIVDPLIGSARTKNNLRRELWAHFCSLVDEERMLGRDGSAAMANAWRRLGNSADIERAYSLDISRAERTMYEFEQWLRLAAAGHRCWLILLLASIVGAVVAACSILGLSFPEWVAGHPGRSTYVFYVALVLSMVGSVCCSTLHAFRRLPKLERLAMAGALQGRLTKPLIAALAWDTLVSCLSTVVCGLIGYLLLVAQHGWMHYDTLAFLNIAPWLLLFIWATTNLTWLYAIPREASYSQPIPDWPYVAR